MSRAVTTFVIIPPLMLAAQAKASKERLEAHLEREFAGYTFNVAESTDFASDDEFCVLPIMNYVNSDGRNTMCEMPYNELLDDIAGTCREFDLSGVRVALQ